MTVPTNGGPWTALLTVAIIAGLSLALVPHAAAEVFRRRRAARAHRERTP